MRLLSFLFLARTLSAGPPGAMIPTSLNLNIPPGFQISLYAKIPGARFMAIAPNADVLVSQPGSGKITLLRPDPNGGAPKSYVYASGLNQPHGMVFHAVGAVTYLYVSEITQITRYPYVQGDTAAHDREVVVSSLPAGGSHPLKNIALDSNHMLYVALGSSCNVCTQDTVSSPQRGAIYQYQADGTGGRLFAQGLRNAEGLAVMPGTNQLFVVVNGRDDVPYPVKDSSLRESRIRVRR